MDVKDLRLIIALSKHEHFARAAESCNISQPAFSTRIRKLEDELGVPIVERGHRFGGFTHEGNIVLKWAQRVITNCDGLKQEIDTARDILTGELTIGVVPSALPYVSVLIQNFTDKQPGVKPTIISMTSENIQRGLIDFSLNAGITYLDNEPISAIKSVHLYNESYVFVGHKAMLGDNLTEISWEKAATYPLCLLTPDMQNRRIIDTTFKNAQITPQIDVETNSFSVILGHVNSSKYGSILPLIYLSSYGMIDELTYLHLKEPEVYQSIGLVVADREPVLPMTRAFWDLTKEFVDGTGSHARKNEEAVS